MVVSHQRGNVSVIPLRAPAPISYPAVGGVADGLAFVARETPRAGPPKPWLLDRVRLALRARHGSRRTEKSHGKRHPAEMGAAEITQSLSWLAVERNVAASTQNQADRIPGL